MLQPEWQNNRREQRHEPRDQRHDARSEPAGHSSEGVAPPDDRITFSGVTCEALAQASYDLTYLIADTLVELQPAMIGAAPKSCKTLIAIDAVISAATATPFLGSLPVPEALRCGYFSGEGGLSVLQDYARRIAYGRGWRLEDISGLVFCDNLPQLADLRHIDAFERFLQEWQLRLVVLDPLYLCMPGDDANNLMKQGKVLRYVNQVCLRNGCTPILVHHTRKNVVDPYAPPELADLAWSGFSEFAGQWWLLGRRAKYDPDQPGEHRLWLNVGGRAGHAALHALDVHEGRRSDMGGRRWAVDVLRPSEAREAARDDQEALRDSAAKERAAKRLEEDKKTITRTMAKFPGGESKSVIRDTSGIRPPRFNAAFAALLADGDVVSCDVVKGNRHKPYAGYKLAE